MLPRRSPLTNAPEAVRRAATEPARRGMRFKFAQERVQKIVDGMPPLTIEQRRQLATMLCPEVLAAGSRDERAS